MQSELRFSYGYPNLYHCFISSVLASGMEQYIIPLPLDSINASIVLAKNNVIPKVIHIDAGHDYKSVCNDLNSWWPLSHVGGIMICDYYHPSRSEFPEVAEAIEDFFVMFHHRFCLQ